MNQSLKRLMGNHGVNRCALVGLLLLPFVGQLVSCKTQLSNTQRAEPFVTDISGNPVYIDKLDNQKTVLFFWATWCPMCGQELASFNNLYAKLQEKGIELIAVGLEDKAENYQAMRDRLQLRYSLVVDAHRQLASRFNVVMVPTLIVVDKNGVPQEFTDPKTSERTKLVEGFRDWTSAEGQAALFALSDSPTAK